MSRFSITFVGKMNAISSEVIIVKVIGTDKL